MLIQGNGPPIADILGSLLSGAGNYIAGAQQAKQKNAAAERQAAIDAQNTAIFHANMQNQGRTDTGDLAPDPYKPATIPGNPATVDPYYGPIAGTPDTTAPPNLNDHIAALVSAGMFGRAKPFQDQAATQQATIGNNITLQSKGFGPDGSRLPDPYTAPPPTMGPGPDVLSGTTNKQGQPVGPPAPGAPVAQAPTLHQQADQLHQHAIALTLAGQTVPGQALGQQADALDRAATAADESAVKFLTAATEKQKAEAQIHHWSTSDSQRATHDAQELAVQIRNGQLTYDAALAHVGATYATAGQAHQDRVAAATQSQQNWLATHNKDGSPKSASSGTNPRQAQALTGEVTTLRKALNDYMYNNNIKDSSLPQAQTKIKAWVASQGFSPAAVQQVAPYAAAPAANPGVTASNPGVPAAPVLPPTKINPANGKTYYLHPADGKYYLTR